MLNQVLTSFLLGLLFFVSGLSLLSFERDFAKRDFHIYGFLSTSNQNETSQIQDDLKERFPKANIRLLDEETREETFPIIALSVPASEKESRVKAYLGTIDNVDQWVSDADLASALQNPESKIRIALWAAFLIATFLVASNLVWQIRRGYLLRRQEIGVWKKLGATPFQIFKAFALKGLSLCMAGLLLALSATSGLAFAKPLSFDLALSRVNAETMVHAFAKTLPVEVETQVAPQMSQAPQAAEKPIVAQAKTPHLVPPLANFWDKKREAGALSGKKGLNLKVAPNEAVVSVLDGTVVYDGTMKGLGQMIIVDHGHGLHSVYAHLGELKTRIDERLQKGQTLGYTGNSDFYFELRQNGKPKSIEEFLDKHALM